MAWRIETARHFGTWATAEGAFLFGGRWNSPGRRVLYASIDPSTAIVEVGVHKGFHTLDTVSHVLLQLQVLDPSKAHVVQQASLPNPHWLRPGTPSAGQQQFGDALFETHPILMVPSVVSPHSWNLLIDVTAAAGLFKLTHSEPFALDPRLNPPSPAGASGSSAR